MKSDWAATLPPSRSTGEAPPSGVAGDMNLVRAALTEIRANVPNSGADIGVSGGGGGGAPPQAIDAMAPLGGLTPIVLGTSGSQTAALQAMINYVATNWGVGRVLLPDGYIRCDTGLTGLGKVRLTGQGLDDTDLNFSAAAGSVLAVDSSGNNTFPLEHLKLTGPNTGDKLTYPINTCTGLRMAGVTTRIEHVRIEKFFKGVRSANPNSFFHTLKDVHIGNAGIGWDLNGGTGNNGGSVPPEFGERMVFEDGSIYNSQMGVDIDKSGVGAFFSNVSLDYLGITAKVIDGFLKISNSHIETGYAAIGSSTQGNWGAMNRWLLDLSYEARVEISTTRFEVRDPGVYALANPGAGPAVYNSGYILLGPCSWYGQMPGGEQRQYSTRDKLWWAATDGATKQVRSPFATKWNSIAARPVYMDGTGVPAGHSVRVTGADISPVGGDVPDQTVDLTRDLASGATATNMWVEVAY